MDNNEQIGFGTIEQVHNFLRDKKFKCSRTLLFQAHGDGKITKDSATGLYLKSDVLSYARDNLLSLAARQDQLDDMHQLKVRKMEADIKRVAALAAAAERKNRIEGGLFIEKEKFNFALTARMNFFRGEIENFGADVASAVEEAATRPPEKRRAWILAWWEERTRRWLDSFAADRFKEEEADLGEITTGLTGGGRGASAVRTEKYASETPQQRQRRKRRGEKTGV